MKDNVVTGSIVQIDPENKTNAAFGACLMVVTEVRDWGVQGYVQALGESRDAGRGGAAFIRLSWDEVEPTGGKVIWIRDHET